MRAKQGFAIEGAIGYEQDGLSSTERQPRERILVRHAARQAQRVFQRCFHVRVLPEARAPHRRSQRRVMDRDDRPVSAALVLDAQHALVSRYRKLADLHSGFVL